jgi:NAD-dependent dihydropyrimidine dehydrogenase PreA subunit
MEVIDMIRKIIEIDKEKCNGCALCVDACHEGAIGMIDGKAVLLRDDYCDGLGDCLPVCPTGAITFVEREAAPFDEEAVKENMRRKQEQLADLPCGCPGSQSRVLKRDIAPSPTPIASIESQLQQWPVQIKLVPINAPYFEGANLLVAADCTAFAYGDFHNRFMKNKVTLIGCPKLDAGDYSEKLTEIIANNNIKSVTVARMEVPCCGGIERAVVTALQNSGKMIPWQIVTISTSGEIVE